MCWNNFETCKQGLAENAWEMSINFRKMLIIQQDMDISKSKPLFNTNNHAWIKEKANDPYHIQTLITFQVINILSLFYASEYINWDIFICNTLMYVLSEMTTMQWQYFFRCQEIKIWNNELKIRPLDIVLSLQFGVSYCNHILLTLHYNSPRTLLIVNELSRGPI